MSGYLGQGSSSRYDDEDFTRAELSNSYDDDYNHFPLSYGSGSFSTEGYNEYSYLTSGNSSRRQRHCATPVRSTQRVQQMSPQSYGTSLSKPQPALQAPERIGDTSSVQPVQEAPKQTWETSTMGAPMMTGGRTECPVHPTAEQYATYYKFNTADDQTWDVDSTGQRIPPKREHIGYKKDKYRANTTSDMTDWALPWRTLPSGSALLRTPVPTPGLHYTTTPAALSYGQGAYEARAGYEAQPEYDAQAVAMNTSGYNQGPYPVSAYPEEPFATTYEGE